MRRHGLPAHDLIFDPLTFTICTGVEADRDHGKNTLDAIARIAREFPDCQILLGLSNISFGLKPAARHVLNSVFLHHRRPGGLPPPSSTSPTSCRCIASIPVQREAAENLIFNRWPDGKDPLLAFVDMFKDVRVQEAKKVRAFDHRGN